jgi:hypothetical protein
MRPHDGEHDTILRAAAVVRKGEFTSYSDISQVVYGHGRGGLAIGRVAMTDTAFPNPHRVLAKGGLIPARWAFPDGTGSRRDAERLLKMDGVQIIHDNAGRSYADPRHYIDYEELRARLPKHKASAS